MRGSCSKYKKIPTYMRTLCVLRLIFGLWIYLSWVAHLTCETWHISLCVNTISLVFFLVSFQLLSNKDNRVHHEVLQKCYILGSDSSYLTQGLIGHTIKQAVYCISHVNLQFNTVIRPSTWQQHHLYQRSASTQSWTIVSCFQHHRCNFLQWSQKLKKTE